VQLSPSLTASPLLLILVNVVTWVVIGKVFNFSITKAVMIAAGLSVFWLTIGGGHTVHAGPTPPGQITTPTQSSP
jgi:hypothetical protein